MNDFQLEKKSEKNLLYFYVLLCDAGVYRKNLFDTRLELNKKY
jgi:hypothetical protein